LVAAAGTATDAKGSTVTAPLVATADTEIDAGAVTALELGDVTVPATTTARVLL